MPGQSRHRRARELRLQGFGPALRIARVEAMLLRSTITCPFCGHKAAETMPTNGGQLFYDCVGCGTKLKPKSGDCCVFCSYGTVPCPSIQSAARRYAEW